MALERLEFQPASPGLNNIFQSPGVLAAFWKKLVPGEGFEPPAFGLQNRCTTTVLTRHQQCGFFHAGAYQVKLRRAILCACAGF